ncbi:hypothetical protein ABZ784_28940 [Streptomyces tendae]|uniref:hypothetical protein n=1 Tax=Streptomyces tendae TaxID=1932 RepID=UPI0033F5BE26
MPTLQDRARQSEAIARDSISRLSNERLASTWDETSQVPVTRAVTITRGWLMDELEARMNTLDVRNAKSPTSLGQAVSRFDQWLDAECGAAEGQTVNVLRYLY